MEAASGRFSSKQILVAEDDYASVTDLVSKLVTMGVSVIGPAPTVETALQLLRNFPNIDGAILDINLRGEMVFPLADELTRRNVPYFFATGYSREIVPPRFADRVFVDKPLNTSAICVALEEMQRSPQKSSPGQNNLILSALSAHDAKVLKPFLKSASLISGQILEMPFEPIKSVYFIESGVLSVIAVSSDGSQVETGLIGREGLTGTGLLDGDLQSAYKLLVQIEGSAHCIDVDAFLRVTARAPQLRSLTSAFARSLGIQVSYTALANGRCTIEQRLSRWLLMLDDRTNGAVLSLTHAYMAIMLGVRRSGVTEALHMLEGEKLIRSVRGKVIIIDRNGLTSKAKQTYGVPEAEYERLMGFALR